VADETDPGGTSAAKPSARDRAKAAAKPAASKPAASKPAAAKKPPARAPEAEDPDTGITAASVDGEGASDDELEARRRARGNGGGSSATRGEQASLDTGDAPADGEGVGEEDDGQLFVWEQGRKVTLGTLIARGTKVEHAFVFGGKRLKGRGQLMGFDADSLIVGRGLVAKTAVVPTRDDDEKVTKVVIETHLAMKVIVPAASPEAETMLGHLYTRNTPAPKASAG
jgi:hypothetical protein